MDVRYFSSTWCALTATQKPQQPNQDASQQIRTLFNIRCFLIDYFMDLYYDSRRIQDRSVPEFIVQACVPEDANCWLVTDETIKGLYVFLDSCDGIDRLYDKEESLARGESIIADFCGGEFVRLSKVKRTFETDRDGKRIAHNSVKAQEFVCQKDARSCQRFKAALLIWGEMMLRSIYSVDYMDVTKYKSHKVKILPTNLKMDYNPLFPYVAFLAQGLAALNLPIPNVLRAIISQGPNQNMSVALSIAATLAQAENSDRYAKDYKVVYSVRDELMKFNMSSPLYGTEYRIAVGHTDQMIPFTYPKTVRLASSAPVNDLNNPEAENPFADSF